MSFVGVVLDMQPLSRLKPHAKITIGLPGTMRKRPNLAALVAECIAEFSNIETMLPVTLAFLLSSDAETTLSMWASLENRAARLRLIDSAAEAQLDDDCLDCWIVLMAKFIRPAQTERDRLAHWSWGYSDELPDDLLIVEPAAKAEAQWHHTNLWPYANPAAQVPRSSVYVLTREDLIRLLRRFDEASTLLELFMKSIWSAGTPIERDRAQRRLCNAPAFDLLLRDHKARKTGQPERSPLHQLMHGG